MDLDELCVGTLFKWRGYPLQSDNHIKDRYFIYLGHTSPLSEPAHYLITGTSKTEYYLPNGLRAGAKRITLCAGDFHLPLDTVFDVDIYLKPCYQLTLIQDRTKFEIVDQISDQILRKLFEQIVTSSAVSLIEKQDIKQCFERHGITGLPPVTRKIQPRHKFRPPR